METPLHTFSSQTPLTSAAFSQFIVHNAHSNDSLDGLVYCHFGNGPLHCAVINTLLNISAILTEHNAHLIRSHTRLIEKIPSWKRNLSPDYDTKNADYLFRMPDDTFIIVSNGTDFDRWGIQTFSATPENASLWANEWAKKYEMPIESEKPAPTFAVLRIDGHDPGTTDVEITRTFAMTDDVLSLLHGDDSIAWERELTASMRANDTGTIIFQGPPGTGKTSLIRHLIDKLKDTHRFYYLPVTHEQLLVSPRMVSFWANENAAWANMKKVIILEDAEMLLERSSFSGRTGSISNLLNIADGLLGEMLKVQILCTVNCEVGQLDSAIIRPGRMIGYREFQRIHPARALRIAAAYDLEIPERTDYALSDIFCRPTSSAPTTRQPCRVLGFAANG